MAWIKGSQRWGLRGGQGKGAALVVKGDASRASGVARRAVSLCCRGAEAASARRGKKQSRAEMGGISVGKKGAQRLEWLTGRARTSAANGERGKRVR